MTDDRTALYRYFDAEGRLLYVGIAFNPIARQSQHRSAAAWYGSLDRMSAEWFATRREALDAERRAISSEDPLHNIKRPSIARPVRTAGRRMYIEHPAIAPSRVFIRTPLSREARDLYDRICYEWWIGGNGEWSFVEQRKAMTWLAQIGTPTSRSSLEHLLNELWGAEMTYDKWNAHLISGFRMQHDGADFRVGVRLNERVCNLMREAWTPKMTFVQEAK